MKGRCNFLVIDLEQGQTVGGSTERRFLVGRGIDEVVEIILTKIALGSLDGRSGEKADHFIKEAISGEGQEIIAVDLLKIGTSDGADVVGVLGLVAAIGGESAEVVLAEEPGKSFGEIFGIELPGEVPGAFGQKGRKNGLEAEVVGVGLGFSGKAGVEIVGDFLAFKNANCGGEFRIERRNPVEGIHGEMIGGVEMRNLAESVDAGVGAAGAVKADGFLGNFREGVFDELLNGFSIGLNLPTGERGAVVGDGEFEVH